jgi:hypothetical protein
LKGRLVFYLLLLALVDVVVPVPVLALLLLYVVWQRPAWFAEAFRQVYGPQG